MAGTVMTTNSEHRLGILAVIEREKNPGAQTENALLMLF
jgi:hypothetical protein